MLNAVSRSGAIADTGGFMVDRIPSSVVVANPDDPESGGGFDQLVAL
jgi:hypothetical protein